MVDGKDGVFTRYFADNQVVIAEDEDDLRYMVRKLKEEHAVTGICMNIIK